MPRPEWIEVGRISRAHGVRGEVRVVPDSDNPERFVSGSVMHARPARPGIAGTGANAHLRLTVDTVRGDDAFPIVAFEEIGDRDAAEALRGYVLEVRSSELPRLDADEFYPFDLVGLEARDPQGHVAGRVAEVVDSPAHAILVLSLERGGERMVPFVHAAVPEVAVSEGYLVIESDFLADGDEGSDAG